MLHGLFGALSNFNELINYFSPKYKIAIPLLPLYDLEVDQTTVTGMVDYIDEFIEFKNYEKVHIIGNSLGGYVSPKEFSNKPELPVRVMVFTLCGLRR